MNAIANITTASSKSAIVAATEERSGVQVGEALSRRNTQVAVFLGIALAERQIKASVGAHAPTVHHQNLASAANVDSFAHTVSLAGNINVGISRVWGGKVRLFVSSTNPTMAHGNCIWHVAEIQIDYAKVNTVEKAARMLQRLIVAAATPGAKLLAA